MAQSMAGPEEFEVPPKEELILPPRPVSRTLIGRNPEKNISGVPEKHMAV